ncbi:MAG: flagellar basal body P-ring formation chaperone FlgA [Synergistetes bacterium]|nr:flagellar basal body P-ring formation chaperone FlgA [Synergistota bacterium]MDW8192953.1 flagellar basal body P-ring formation chaperone FlgA [Synergistota bacterium]
MLRRAFLIAVLLVLIPSTAFCVRALIDISNYSEVKGSIVLLGDIAKISGQDIALIDCLKKVKIAEAPLNGGTLELSLLDIRDALLRSKLDLKDVLFRVPDKIVVASASRGSLDRVLGDYLVSKFGPSVSWSLLSNPSLPPDARYSVVDSIVRRENFYVLPVVYYRDDGSMGRAELMVKLSLRKNVVVALRNLAWHEVISEGDVALIEKEVDPLFPVCTSLDQVLGKMLKKPVKKGDIIISSHLDSPNVVKRGSPVTIIAKVGSVEVKAQGKACESGGVGDQIEVLNTSTGRRIKAVVLGPGMVEALILEGGELKCER